ncbi:MAG: hypothetical protein OQK24_02840 [Magnetovibrio sp.]|nr:hypothetical protein [Magnetovibrio sp.]
MLIQSFKTMLMASAVIAFISTVAQAGTLENLERERAQTVNYFLDSNLQPNERHARIEVSKRRLIDMERMVLRDNSLRGKTTPIVRRAFLNYDVTFMAHSATEKNLTMLDNWLDQFSVNTDSLMSAKIGRR